MRLTECKVCKGEGLEDMDVCYLCLGTGKILQENEKEYEALSLPNFFFKLAQMVLKKGDKTKMVSYNQIKKEMNLSDEDINKALDTYIECKYVRYYERQRIKPTFYGLTKLGWNMYNLALKKSKEESHEN